MKKALKSLRRILIGVLLVAALLLTGIWVWICQPVWVRTETAARRADPQRMEQVVRTLSVDFSPRDYMHPENLLKTVDLIDSHFQQTGGTVSRQSFTGFGEPYVNVRCLLDGPGDRRLVIGAHYDSHADTPGADDNASGVAGLIELAYLLSGQALPCDVELVAYCLEEPPFFGSEEMGSYVHASRLMDQQVDVIGMLALEMIGYFQDEPGTQTYPLPFFHALYPSAGNFIAVIARPTERQMVEEVKRSLKRIEGLEVHSFLGPERMPGIDFSDHRNFWKFDIPAVMITDTAFYRNQAYHAEEDTWDRLDYSRMALVAEGTARVVLDWE